MKTTDDWYDDVYNTYRRVEDGEITDYWFLDDLVYKITECQNDSFDEFVKYVIDSYNHTISCLESIVNNRENNEFAVAMLNDIKTQEDTFLSFVNAFEKTLFRRR